MKGVDELHTEKAPAKISKRLLPEE